MRPSAPVCARGNRVQRRGDRRRAGLTEPRPKGIHDLPRLELPFGEVEEVRLRLSEFSAQLSVAAWSLMGLGGGIGRIHVGRLRQLNRVSQRRSEPRAFPANPVGGRWFNRRKLLPLLTTDGRQPPSRRVKWQSGILPRFALRRITDASPCTTSKYGRSERI